MLEQKCIDRYWKKVDKKSNDECWGWKAGTSRGGYGTMDFDYKKYYAHRMSWMIHFGEIPEGLLVCHHCDNRICSNPQHLFLGTYQDNSSDARSKGKWDDFKKHDFTELKRLLSNHTQSEVARQLGLSRQRISKIIRQYGIVKVKISRTKLTRNSV